MSNEAVVAERARRYFQTRAREMDLRELRAELIVGGIYLGLAMLLAALGGADGGAAPGLVALYVAALAVASRVRFDIGGSFTVPIQVGFVALLFVGPTALVPLLVVAALVLAQAPDVLAGRTPATRLLSVPGNA